MDKLEKDVVYDFGNEWKRYDQSKLDSDLKIKLFDAYFNIFPKNFLEKSKCGIDAGCGSGRWAEIVSKKVDKLVCFDASFSALETSRINLSKNLNCTLVNGSVTDLPFRNEEFDFAYSLGVLHHIKNTQLAFNEIGRCLKKGSPFLVYVYYRLSNKNVLYRAIWYISDFLRRFISVLPLFLKTKVTDFIAVFAYYPLSRIALICSLLFPHRNITNFPLYYYRDLSFYVMRTDSLDRFGTKLEKRFSRAEIEIMMQNAGFENVTFSDIEPYWCAVGYKR